MDLPEAESMGLKTTISALLIVLLALSGLAPAAAETNVDDRTAASSDVDAVVGDRLLVIHDSVILGARRQIEATFPNTQVDYIGFGGMRAGPAADILSGRPELITDQVVVEIGTNYLGSQSLFRRELDRLMGLLAGVDHVLWLTPSRYTGRMDQVHAEIRAAARRYPNLQVGEWTYVTAGDPLLTWNDGIHLRPRGADAIANLIRRHLAGEVPWNRIPVGRIDRMLDRRTGLRLAGWALDPDLGRPARVRVMVDGKRVARKRSSKARTRLGKFLGVDDRLGFAVTLKLPDGKHQVCIEVNNFDGHDPVVLGCRNVNLAHEPVGAIERVVPKSDGDVVRGWAYDPDRRRPIHIDVVSGSEVVATSRASRTRTDLAGLTNGEQRGFAIKLPAGLVDYCLIARNELAGEADTTIGCN